MQKAFSKPDKTVVPGQERSVSVHVKSLREPPIDLKLTSQPLATSILDLKSTVSEKTRIPVEKMRLLHRKKPVPDSKVLKDLLGGEEISIEFSVMVIGGAAAIKPAESKDESNVAAGGMATGGVATGAAALETQAFWDDLKGFLMQRLKDEKQAEELAKTWRIDWDEKR
ncbi:hypothetical protein SODALDRAFT_327745 [Sodiomyces alkalinus F11]|uniref:Ubiquitin-like domain-containing protein n=1 Tax=Sodiomyces alkalinus (strain CBS 110278 / VKM F-3762 / F11) TaxID=1314773 RepID=A0A3N2QA48_SODAK|nr:hypothetical protein SODALDRAFT_327745 [Sodiomyces alkalinus F11]ROT43538.1 hypothetical protein SODALDRAFT_327745 [Sodiomyces alkalinus F11]